MNSAIEKTSQISHKLDKGGTTHTVHARAHPHRQVLRALSV
jgi:hypothetical protein